MVTYDPAHVYDPADQKGYCPRMGMRRLSREGYGCTMMTDDLLRLTHRRYESFVANQHHLRRHTHYHHHGLHVLNEANPGAAKERNLTWCSSQTYVRSGTDHIQRRRGVWTLVM